MDNAIEIKGLWKQYGLPIPKVLRHGFGWLWGGGHADSHWALKDVSISVERGEILGIIGRNGAGKSTLLKVLAGVSPTTRGAVKTVGRVFPMIELNAGIHRELTGRENAYLIGAVMGLSRTCMTDRIEAIQEFCELGDWFEESVRKYSSGMLARLGFGVAMNIESEILLVDEVLAVGDLAFQRKCYSSFDNLMRRGATIVFVSHNIRQVQRLCSRVVYLDDGTVVDDGEPARVCSFYQEASIGEVLANARKMVYDNSEYDGSGEVEFRGLELLNENGESVERISTFDKICMRVRYRCEKELSGLYMGIGIHTSEMVRISILRPTSAVDGKITMSGEGFFECVMPSVPLLPDTYTLSLNIKSSEGRNIFKGNNIASFGIEYSDAAINRPTIVHLDSTWSFK